jgi:rhodanese-related sulfurtransferase
MQIITVTDLMKRINANEPVNLIDVREPEERDVFHIGGKLLPLGHIMSMQSDDIDELKNEEVICYCRSGQRSAQACLMLETVGFTNVKNLSGGMNEWQEKTAEFQTKN